MTPRTPSNSLAINTVRAIDHFPSKSFYFDMERGRVSGRTVEGIDEIKQAIAIICSMERGKCPGMPDDFGLELDGILGRKKQFVKANLARIIRKAITVDDRIKDAYDFNFTDLDDNSIHTSFTVELESDVTFKTEVIINA